MFNINPTLRFFGFCFGLFLVLFSGACNKEDDITPEHELLSNGSFVEFEFKGKTYKIDGFGSASFVDTVLVFDGNTMPVKNALHVFVGAGRKLFSFSLINYNGKGKYNTPDLSDSTPSGVVSFLYNENPAPGEYWSIHVSRRDEDEKEIDIKVDNATELSGTFSFMGRTDFSGETFPCTGKFKIVK